MVEYFMNKDELIKYLSDVLIINNPPKEIAAIYLFGSALKDGLRKESDIDIAILLFSGVAQERSLEIIAELETIITRYLHKINIHNEVGITDLTDTGISDLLVYKIITEGILLYESDSAGMYRRSFESTAIGKYFDFIPYYKKEMQRRYGHIS